MNITVMLNRMTIEELEEWVSKPWGSMSIDNMCELLGENVTYQFIGFYILKKRKQHGR